MKSKRTKATDISQKTKQVVWERDNHSCILCGKTGYGVMPNAHYLPRSKGGKGIEQNIITLCQSCHHTFDFGAYEQQALYKQAIKEYLQSKYIDWNEKDLIYNKWGWLD